MGCVFKDNVIEEYKLCVSKTIVADKIIVLISFKEMPFRVLSKNFNLDLVYGQLKLCCVRGWGEHEDRYIWDRNWETYFINLIQV